MLKLNKEKLDLLTTVFGIIAGVSAVLGTYEVISPTIAGLAGGISTVLLGTLAQRPANQSPTTEDLEQKY